MGPTYYSKTKRLALEPASGLLSQGTLRAAMFTLVLGLLPLRRVSGEDRLDTKFLYYEEEHGRVKVTGPSLLSETELSSSLTLKLGALYNTISGASPTGAPPATPTVMTPSSTSASASGMSTVSGASRSAGSSTGSTGTAPGQLPTGQVVDERYAGNVGFDKRFGDNILGAMLYYSTERDYRSVAGSLQWTREFNEKNTVVNAGVSYSADSVDVFSQSNTQSKNSVDWLLGLTQILDSKTVLAFSLGGGFASGYLGDGYKYAQVNGVLLPESRPNDRDRQTANISLTRSVEPLNGSVEGSYRLYRDSYGIWAHTVSLSWHQKIGPSVLVSPFVRYYTQSAASFYDVTFSGAPTWYSADYRLSSMSTCSYGVEINWAIREWLSFDVSYERYHMWGDDGKTSQDAYPTANIISTGFRFRF